MIYCALAVGHALGCRVACNINFTFLYRYSATRRGQSVCLLGIIIHYSPSGSFVGVAEEFLRRKVAEMEEPMHSLEDALVIIEVSASY